MSKSDKSNEKRLRLVRQSMAFGLSTEESLQHLKENGIIICERTLRRDKEELKNQYGSKVRDIFEKEIASDIYKDFFSLQEIHNECWNMIRDKKTPINEKIRLFNCILKTLNEKLTLPHKLPNKVRDGIIITTSDENSPFEVTLKQSSPYYSPSLMRWKDLLPDKTQEENDRKTDKISQGCDPQNLSTKVHS